MKLRNRIWVKGWLTAIPLFFLWVSVNAQSIRYSNFYDSNSGAEILDEAIILNDGSLLVAGKTSNSNGSGFGKVFNLVVSEDGSLQYSHVWEESQMTIGPYAIVQTEHGGIFEAGTIHDYSVPSLGTGDFFLAKLDETGDTLFTKVYARPDTSDFLLDIVQTRPNKLLLIGWTYDDTVAVSSAAQLLFITVDTLGNELNRVVWGGGGTDYVHSGLVINDDGEVLMTGWKGNDSWLVKTDSIGNVLWFQTYHQLAPNGGDGGTCVVPTTDGNFAILGGSENPSSGFSDGYILKVDPTGNEIWTQKYVAGSGSQSLWWGQVLDDGSFVACGQTTDTDDDSQAGWLIKTDADGELIWSRTFNPSGFIDRLLNMLVMPNGDIVMIGNGRAPNEVIQDGWILRVDSNGCLVEGCYSVGIEELEQEEQYLKAYPNPFNQQVTLAYDLKEDCDAGCFIRLTDIRGRIVLQQPISTGNGPNSITFDLGRYETGMYICSLYNNHRLLQTSRLIRME
jgi:hypothetical protein